MEKNASLDSSASPQNDGEDEILRSAQNDGWEAKTKPKKNSFKSGFDDN